MLLCRRYELKYIVSASVVHAIEGKLIGHCAHDVHGSEGCYINETLYFDSPSLDFYFQKIEGVKLRRKVRIRRHGDTGPWEKVFVEIKRRNGQYIEKARFSLPTQLLPFLFDSFQRKKIIYTLTPAEIQVYNEVSALARLFHLRPIIFIRYQRKAFWAKGDERLRITFDSDLSYDVVNQNCVSPLENTQLMLGGDQIVMEVKANGRIPFWVLELIKECGCRMVRLSKYCLGVQRAQGLRGMYLNYSGKETTTGTP
jgi:hypothetical protein